MVIAKFSESSCTTFKENYKSVGLAKRSLAKWPFALQHQQYPVCLCYAMTINKSQGQTLDRVGVYLPKPAFSHGQFYVAISRVTSREGLKVLALDESGMPTMQTRNIVNREVLGHL